MNDGPTKQRPGNDAGGAAHTEPGEPHPDLQKEERSHRAVGGPTASPDKPAEQTADD